jgi:hypothetical protein
MHGGRGEALERDREMEEDMDKGNDDMEICTSV